MEVFLYWQDDSLSANTGAGWASLKLHEYIDASAFFARNPSDADANAGWSFALWALGNDTLAIRRADVVLTADSNYVFKHDTNIDRRDLILIKANAYYKLAAYSECLTEIQELDTQFNPSIPASDSAQVLLAKLTTLGPVH